MMSVDHALSQGERELCTFSLWEKDRMRASGAVINNES